MNESMFGLDVQVDVPKYDFCEIDPEDESVCFLEKEDSWIQMTFLSLILLMVKEAED